MWFLYLDESGDLGFDFVNKKPSNFFTISILAVKGIDNNRNVINGIKKTLKRKFRNKIRTVDELKGVATTIEIKKYFFKQIKNIPFAIFSVTLNKRRVYEKLTREKERVYNWVAKLVLEKIKFERADLQVELIVDRSKSQKQIKEFNDYIFNQLKTRIDPNVPLNIRHEDSKKFIGLQAADMFSWGIFRKYENKKTDWYDIFSNKIKYDEQYL